MTWQEIRNRLNIPLARHAPIATAAFTLPTAILEIQPDFVTGVRLAGKANGSAKSMRLRSIAVAGLGSGALVPVAYQANVVNPDELDRALQAVRKTVVNGSSRFGLVVPDGTVCVSILSFESLPSKAKEANALMRWRIAESLPFPLEEARISHQVTRRDSQGIEVLAVAAKASVLAEYEKAMERINGGPVLMIPATLALLPLLHESVERGQVLIHVCCGWITSAVVTGNRLRLWRSRRITSVEPESLARESQAEAARVLASTRDHLKVEVEHIWFCSRPPALAELRDELSKALSRQVEILKPDPEMASALSGEDRSLFDSFGATAAGLVLNTG